MGNKRVSQLVELTSLEVANDDLLLIIDTSARESKKITVTQLSSYFNVSGSIIAISATLADTASYILGSNVHGQVESSSFANKTHISISSSWASSSLSSSYALTASFVDNIPNITNSDTASHLLYTGINNGTSSHALTASLVYNSRTSSHLLYIPGIDNGTSFRSISASYAPSNPAGATLSASHALRSDWADNSVVSDQTNYLVYSGLDNGTSSYALTAGSVPSILFNYGIFLADSQSSTKAQLDSVNVTPSSGNPVITSVEAWGTLNVDYTSSIITSGSIQLIAINRNSGETIYLDNSSVLFSINPLFDSGSLTIPYSLVGQSTLSSSQYEVYVTTSCSESILNIQINPTRTTRFNINSYSNIITDTISEPVLFLITTSSLLKFTTTDGGPYFDYRDGIIATGSSKILTIDAYNKNIDIVKYAYTLPNLTRFDVSDNGDLFSLSGFGNLLEHLSASGCSITSIASLSNVISMSYLDISSNALSSLPNLPQTLSMLNCNNNNITALPNLPYGLNILSASNNNITSVPTSYPPLLYSMSLDNNVNLTSYLTGLPISMSYLSCNNSPVNYIVYVEPLSASQILASNCNLDSLSMRDITDIAVKSSMSGGYIDITLNGIPSVTTLTNIATLQSRGWTILYDTV